LSKSYIPNPFKGKHKKIFLRHWDRERFSRTQKTSMMGFHQNYNLLGWACGSEAKALA
jgi:hypothetical protein